MTGGTAIAEHPTEPWTTAGARLRSAAGIGAVALLGDWPTELALRHLVRVADDIADVIERSIT